MTCMNAKSHERPETLWVQWKHALKREYYERDCHLEDVDNECSEKVFFPAHSASRIYADESIDSSLDWIEDLVQSAGG